MKSLNMVQLIGNVGRDAELTYTQGGKAICKLSIATERGIPNGDGTYRNETDWHNVTIWNAEKLAVFLTKGTRVYVEGRLHTRMYEKDGQKHYSTEVVAENVILLGGNAGRGDSGPATGNPQSTASANSGNPAPVGGFAGDDDVPF